jgi:hypothetical protein
MVTFFFLEGPLLNRKLMRMIIGYCNCSANSGRCVDYGTSLARFMRTRFVQGTVRFISFLYIFEIY